MEKQSNGSLCFRVKKDVFIFEKTNYDKHCQDHPILKDELFLQEIEKTLFSPDTITEQPKLKKNIKIYYGVLKQINNKYNIQVRILKMPVVKTKKIYFILTVFDFWAFNWQVIHNSEKIIWQKPESLLS